MLSGNIFQYTIYFQYVMHHCRQPILSARIWTEGLKKMRRKKYAQAAVW